MFTTLDKNIITISALIILYTLECIFPYFDNWTGKNKHALRNAGIAIFNAVIINILLIPVIVLSANTPWGLFNQINISLTTEIILTILLIDALTYVLHVIYHRVPFFWNFHRMHHSDNAMDVTSGSRFHIGEHVISLLTRSVLYATFAMKLEIILIYETIFIISVFFHHSNITISEPVDKIFRIFFTSPNMHKVHHSNIREEADSNYTSFFSFWDRLFGTYKIIKNPKDITYGVKGLEEDQSISKMLKTPFQK